ncbi:glutamyl-tRNA(Gln) amidotransferase subunit C [Planoprotostelium fungivorum]|uniref:Glutamyl-tRNA(Gln) amidotransferase subunit C n=1 Tax=Planoprotostelium fungivorum TaxID=1890364 RepID=A0A2P6NDL6_9EUKA|nr:glutamyl-tRNA(Gln) amidotransferase subunit C [Planoprotostelium fungivorum]
MIQTGLLCRWASLSKRKMATINIQHKPFKGFEQPTWSVSIFLNKPENTDTISAERVRQLASSTKIKVTEESVEGLVTDLRQILGFVGQLSSASAEGVEPLITPIEECIQVTDNRWREDVSTVTDTKDVMGHTKNVHRSYFTSPNVKDPPP